MYRDDIYPDEDMYGEDIKENPVFSDDLIVGLSGAASLGTISYYFDNKMGLNWWQNLLASSGVTLGGTVIVDTFMSRDYAEVYFYGAVLGMGIKVLRQTIKENFPVDELE